jgi:hypothetical protein
MNIPLIYNSDRSSVIGIYKSLKDSVEANGTFMPNVVRVIFSLKTTEQVSVKDKQGEVEFKQATNADGTKLFRKDGTTPVMLPVMQTVDVEPVLTTTVYFADGTRVTVKNSEHDKIRLTTKKLADGTDIKVADPCSLESGVVYAIVKRAMGRLTVDKNGNPIGGEGFTGALMKLVKEGVDQTFDAANAKAIKRMKKAAKKPVEKKANAKPAAEKAVNKIAFKDMSQEQKREYWRKANAKRSAAKHVASAKTRKRRNTK